MAFIVDETPWVGGLITPKIYCLKADNPSPMTYVGTNIYIVSAVGFPGLNDAQDTSSNEAINKLNKPKALVIDPSPSGEQIKKLLECCDKLGVVIGAVLLTHTHHDHSEGACEAVVEAAKKQGADIASIPLYSKSFTLQEQKDILEMLEAGPLPEGSEQVVFLPLEETNGRASFVPFEGGPCLEVVAIPGHSADSMGIFYKEENVLFTGDVAFRHGPTVVFHPDGVLKDYMDTLDKLDDIARANPGVVFAPGHGYPIEDTFACVDATRKHREERLEQIKEALSRGVPADADALVDDVYVGVDPRLRFASIKSVQAQLLNLKENKLL